MTDNRRAQTQLLSAPRALQTSEELFFLLRIYKCQERWTEAVQLLNSENVGLGSRIANNDRFFMFEKVHCLGSAGLWQDALAYSKSLLTVPDNENGRQALKERDDWKIWNLLRSTAQPARRKRVSTLIILLCAD